MLTVLKAIKRWLRPTPSLREAHRRYQLHLREDGSCDFLAAGLTYIECEALTWVLKYSPKAAEGKFDLETAHATWWPEHQHRAEFTLEDRSFHHRIIQLLERWEEQEMEAKNRLNMPPGAQHPFFGSTTGYTHMF